MNGTLYLFFFIASYNVVKRFIQLFSSCENGSVTSVGFLSVLRFFSPARAFVRLGRRLCAISRCIIRQQLLMS